MDRKQDRDDGGQSAQSPPQDDSDEAEAQALEETQREAAEEREGERGYQ